MRDYKELYREAKGDMPRIYVDMDGVLCDFVLAAKRATGQKAEINTVVMDIKINKDKEKKDEDL